MLQQGLRRALQGQRGASGTCRFAVTSLLARNHSTSTESVEVCFIDPALVTEPARLAQLKAEAQGGSVRPYVCLPLPAQLVAQLESGRFQLGDMDDPHSAWHFGKEGEIFQYKYQGSIAVQSGFTSAVHAEAVQRAERGEASGPGAASWAEVAEGIDAGAPPPAPFLFAGRVVDCESAGVYTLAGGGGEAAGLMVSSEYESAA